ncbi:MAG: YggS family pyridoxal phosphate-dependent enzyme [Candidatus Abyssobacteria bacterium SURF_17]|uniref:Pyridoxal phosphate homeostasis protein n=1 Tax=Candidatus Abyssobacteria bacterium SURF_17 TaxID=2093361 RepID=A0A419ETL2_9BACT|nr:MAG: YggS family pyridoxal phosphate-dependent enzyme [Candidatus Abyssubacteria bacterium SURF_17]
MSIRENLLRLTGRIERAAEGAGRDPKSIQLVVVTKTVGVEQIREAIDCGVKLLGENRVHEALEKQAEIGRASVEWHMVGHLQSRKAKQAAEAFDMIQSVESISTAEALDKRCGVLGRSMPILIEVNTSGEEQKYGVSLEGAESFIRRVARMRPLRVEGLMTMAAFVADPEEARASFRRLRELANELATKNIEGASFRVLSMGMSNDFEVAIEEGATMIRIGTAIFAE